MIGVVLAACAGLLAAKSRTIRLRRRTARHRAREAGPNHERARLFLASVGAQGELFEATHMQIAGSLPLLTHPSLSFEVDVRESSGLFQLTSSEIRRLPEDDKVIARRRAVGTELWNGDLIHVVGADLSQSPPALRLARSTYFSYVTATQRVLEALWSPRPGRSKALAGYRSVETAMCSTQPPLWMSAAVVTVIHAGGTDARVIIHRRSKGVVNAPGIRTVAPVFGFDAAMIGERSSKLGIPLFNMVREYAEELFDRELVVRANQDTWFDPDQIIDAIPEIGVLLDDLAGGRVSAKVVGMCVNPKDCDLSVAYLLEIPEDSGSGQLLSRRMKAGWEAAVGETGEAAVELLDLYDRRLDGWARSGQLYPTSAFAIDRARAVMAGRTSANAPGPGR